MKIKTKLPLNAKSKEQGFTLVLSMILLALVSLIAVSAATTSFFQEKMTGVEIDVHRDFESAEAAVSAQEQCLKALWDTADADGTLEQFDLSGTGESTCGVSIEFTNPACGIVSVSSDALLGASAGGVTIKTDYYLPPPEGQAFWGCKKTQSGMTCDGAKITMCHVNWEYKPFDADLDGAITCADMPPWSDQPYSFWDGTYNPVLVPDPNALVWDGVTYLPDYTATVEDPPGSGNFVWDGFTYTTDPDPNALVWDGVTYIPDPGGATTENWQSVDSCDLSDPTTCTCTPTQPARPAYWDLFKVDPADVASLVASGELTADNQWDIDEDGVPEYYYLQPLNEAEWWAIFENPQNCGGIPPPGGIADCSAIDGACIPKSPYNTLDIDNDSWYDNGGSAAHFGEHGCDYEGPCAAGGFLTCREAFGDNPRRLSWNQVWD